MILITTLANFFTLIDLDNMLDRDYSDINGNVKTAEIIPSPLNTLSIDR
jgi:hypothetical protein